MSQGMDFEAEMQAAFGEVGEKAMPVEFFLTNDRHTGVVQLMASGVEMTEPGLAGKQQVMIACVRSQFTRPPMDSKREIVSITQGPLAGKYVLINVYGDVAHWNLECVATN